MKEFFTSLLTKFKSLFVKEVVVEEEESTTLRKFLEKVAYVCTDEETTADRITKDMLLKYDYEIENPESVFRMQSVDFDNPRGRVELGFMWKHLDCVDFDKAQRAEDLVLALSLYEYNIKYSTTTFDTEIEEIKSTISNNRIREVETLLELDSSLVTRGTWSD